MIRTARGDQVLIAAGPPLWGGVLADDRGGILGRHAVQVQADLLWWFDRGPRLWERLSGVCLRAAHRHAVRLTRPTTDRPRSFQGRRPVLALAGVTP
jgi:hypothetical protein